MSECALNVYQTRECDTFGRNAHEIDYSSVLIHEESLQSVPYVLYVVSDQSIL